MEKLKQGWRGVYTNRTGQRLVLEAVEEGLPGRVMGALRQRSGREECVNAWGKTVQAEGV